MTQFKREHVVWTVCCIGLIGLPFFSMPTEDVSWKGFAETYCEELTTQFASNNGSNANTFDLQNAGSNSVEITSWLVNLNNQGQTTDIDIYWRVGTANGFEANAAGWTLLGSHTGVLSNGQDIPTPVAMPPFIIHSGELYGFYVHSSNPYLRYTNGGPTIYSDSNFMLTTYHGRSAPAFGGSTHGLREWNGTVQYCEYVFLDGFESGNTSAWSNEVP